MGSYKHIVSKKKRKKTPQLDRATFELEKRQSLVTECCENEENIALRSSQILPTSVLRAEKQTASGSS